MTAVMERPMEAAIEHLDAIELTPAPDALTLTLAAHTRMLETLDARREQLDELIADMMPIANAMMLMVNRELASVSGAKTPGTIGLLKQLRDPDVRRGLALATAALGALGRATSSVQADRKHTNGRKT